MISPGDRSNPTMQTTCMHRTHIHLITKRPHNPTVNEITKQQSESGTRRSLTEKIVRVLQRMECPFQLEPHQMSLQGMDCIHIFPVIQWLVKRSIEFRVSRAEAIKRHAIRRFNCTHPDLPEVRISPVHLWVG